MAAVALGVKVEEKIPGHLVHLPEEGEAVRFQVNEEDAIEIRMFGGTLIVRSLMGQIRIYPTTSNQVNIESTVDD